ncbi:MAG TPA: Dabb family protein [Bacteroidota bacterium]|nr:Dabb family protein [Bacteroidota bacterium]
MIKHIVVWKLKNFAEGGSKQKNALKVKELLESMHGKIPGLHHIEVGINFTNEENAGDIVLYSELDSREALDAYQNHPAHVAVKDFIKNVRSERQVIDYEV